MRARPLTEPGMLRFAGAHDDPAVSPRLAAHGAATLTLLGAALALWSVFIDGGGPTFLSLAVVAASICCGLVLLGVPRAQVGTAFHIAAALAAACVASAITSSEAAATSAHVFFVPVVVYVAYFLTRPALIAFAVAICAGYTTIAFAQSVDAAVPRAAFLALTVIATAGLVRLLRDHVFDLIAALDRTARTDALTGVLNRLGMDERLEDELERASRAGGDCAILMADLDEFKALNDDHGHHAGDDALRHVAATIASRVRRLDTIARFGGDEFVVILPGTSRQAATTLAVELAQAIRAHDGGHRWSLDASFGVAVYPADGACADDVLRAADADLLRAKRRPVAARDDRAREERTASAMI